ncbi:MAG: shikimate kinase [archaeon]
MKNIVLVGYRCTGKTEAGKKVALELGFQFIDTDRWIEKDAGTDISRFVSKYGWDEFRELERKIVARASRQTGAVISAGGGTVLDDDNVFNLKRNGVVFWLGARPEVIFQRMNADPKSDTQRPSLTDGKDALAEIEETLGERLEKYERASDHKIDTSDIGIEDVVKKIVRIYRNSTKL